MLGAGQSPLSAAVVLSGLASDTARITVTPVNHAPTLDPIADVTILENAGQQTVNLSGIGTGAANETQTLTVTATSSNPTFPEEAVPVFLGAMR